MKLTLRSKIATLVLALSLAPIILLTAISVRSLRDELGKVVRADMASMASFIWQILDAHEQLVQEAEIGEDIVLFLQAREQEKTFSLNEDAASITRWKGLVAQLGASSIWAGKMPESKAKYEATFLAFTQGKLANITELDRTGHALEVDLRRAASASEELSAQAQELNGMVGDLIAIVGGNSGGAPGPGPQGPASKKGDVKGNRVARKITLGALATVVPLIVVAGLLAELVGVVGGTAARAEAARGIGAANHG